MRLLLISFRSTPSCFLFFFNGPATTEIYTLPYTTLFRSMESSSCCPFTMSDPCPPFRPVVDGIYITESHPGKRDRKSTRLNSSHSQISYAVFCLKKKRKNTHSQAHADTHTTTHDRISNLL